MTGTEPRTLGRGLVSRQLVLYALIGASGVLLDYALFLLLFNVAGWHEQVANAVSTTAGITNNFLLNAFFNFRKHDRILLRALRFYTVGAAGIGLTFLLLEVFSGWLGINANLVKALSLPVVLLFQYTVNKKWSFR
ncbi:GtrA family protein [Saccharopolyspora rectivirgula]|jgi:putative flippase GtrA|uniref:Dolichyl-phosphate beta-D-mannosyltransferase n=1 Tax=Saccharopolyspora rectivirgula TaxID=28042 RepID=A0A073B780_9PSEU|nr:GtrA family protein [Saccharopolyspora rectivirgula]KEI43534.1 dolichyl-phosphate beta-D-mannosyltransferase [Saccharopolyspora rectivirgula]